jgi:hypothetical protein
MKVTVKTISNGWMVAVPIYHETMTGPYRFRLDEVGTTEVAFTYDFKEERDRTWGKVLDFITEKMKTW